MASSLGGGLSFNVIPGLDKTATDRLKATIDDVTKPKDVRVKLDADLKAYEAKIAAIQRQAITVKAKADLASADITKAQFDAIIGKANEVDFKAKADLASAKLASAELSAEADLAGNNAGNGFGSKFASGMKGFFRPGGLIENAFSVGLTALPHIAAAAAAVAGVAGAAALGVVFTAAVIKLDPKVAAAGKALGTSLGTDFITGTKASGFDTALIDTFNGLKGKLKGPIESIGDTLGKAFLPALQPIEDGLSSVAHWLADKLPGAIATAKQWLGKIDWGKMGTDIGNAGSVLKNIVVPAFSGWQAVMQPVAHILDETLVPALEWISKHPEVAEILGGMAAAFKAMSIVSSIASGIGAIVKTSTAVIEGAIAVATWSWSAAQGALDIAMGIFDAELDAVGIGELLLAIGLLVLGIIELIKHWKDVAHAIAVAWDAIVKATEIAVKAVVNWISNGGIQKAWDDVVSFVKAAWHDIPAFFSKTWSDITGAFTNALKTVKGAVTGTWSDISHATMSAWDDVFDFFKGIWGKIENVFTGAFKSIGNWVSTAWNTAFTTTKNLWSKITGTISGAWTDIKTDASNALGWVKSKMSGFWTDIKNDAATGWNHIVSAVSDAWGKLKSVVEAPVKFVVNTIYNDALVPLWNDTGGLVNLPKLKPLSLSFAKGGVIPGAASSVTQDNQLAMVKSGELIIPSQHAPKFQDMARRASIPGFATGGVVPGTPAAAQQSTAQMNAKEKALLGTENSNIANVAKPLAGAISTGEKYARDIAAKGLAWVFQHTLNPLINMIPGVSGNGPMGQMVPDTMKAIEAGIVAWVQGNGNGQPDSGGSAVPGGATGSEMANGAEILAYLATNVFGGNARAAAGATASIFGESAWNPFAQGTGGRGLIGWTPPGTISNSDFSGGLRTQLPAVVRFIGSSGDWGVISRMKAAASDNSSIATLAEMWGKGVERYGIDDVHSAGVALATQLLNQYNGAQSKASAASPANASNKEAAALASHSEGGFAAGGIVGQVNSKLAQITEEENTIASLAKIKKPTRSESLSLKNDKVKLGLYKSELGKLEGTSAADAVKAANAKVAASKAASAAAAQAADQARILKLGESYSHAQLVSMAASYKTKMAAEAKAGQYKSYASTSMAYNDVEAAIGKWPTQLNAQHDADVSAHNTDAAMAAKYLKANDLKDYAYWNEKALSQATAISKVDASIAAASASASATGAATASTTVAGPVAALANALSSKGYLKSLGTQLELHSTNPSPVGNLDVAQMKALALDVPAGAVLDSIYSGNAADLATGLMASIANPYANYGNIDQTMALLGRLSGQHGRVSGLAFKAGGTLPEKILGVGASGRSYSFGAGEHVTKAPVVNPNSNTDITTRLDRLISRMEENNKIAAVTANNTNSSAKALGNVGRNVRF